MTERHVDAEPKLDPRDGRQRAVRAGFAIVAIALFGFVVVGGIQRPSVEARGTGEPELLAVTFSSAFCGPCRVLKPKLAAVAPRYANEPARFIELDFTFGETEARRIAAEEGVTDALEGAGGATGFTMLLDRDTGDTIDVLTMSHSEEAMASAIDAALAVARATRAAPQRP